MHEICNIDIVYSIVSHELPFTAHTLAHKQLSLRMWSVDAIPASTVAQLPVHFAYCTQHAYNYVLRNTKVGKKAWDSPETWYSIRIRYAMARESHTVQTKLHCGVRLPAMCPHIRNFGSRGTEIGSITQMTHWAIRHTTYVMWVCVCVFFFVLVLMVGLRWVCVTRFQLPRTSMHMHIVNANAAMYI